MSCVPSWQQRHSGRDPCKQYVEGADASANADDGLGPQLDAVQKPGQKKSKDLSYLQKNETTSKW